MCWGFSAFDGFDICADVFRVCGASSVVVRVRRRAEAEIGAVLPVAEIVAADEIVRGIVVAIRWRRGTWRGKRVVSD